MARYMWQVSYTAEGARGVLEEGGSSRRAIVEKLAKEMGGSIEAFYYAFGDDDVIVIADLPGHADAVGLAMNVAASGAASIKTTVLLTPEEVDAASKKAISYRPPGA